MIVNSGLKWIENYDELMVAFEIKMIVGNMYYTLGFQKEISFYGIVYRRPHVSYPHNWLDILEDKM